MILTPHVGGSTQEAQGAIGNEVAESILRFFNRGTTFGAVNFPQIDPPALKSVRRIVNIHKNVTGVLRDINSSVSDLGVNIVAQFLATDENIGYIIMDVEETRHGELAERIGKSPNSLRTRIIDR